MKRNKAWMGMLVLVLIFGLMVVGCNNNPSSDDNSSGGNNPNGGSTDPALNGTWIPQGTDEGKYIFIFANGVFDNQKQDGTPAAKGTYTTHDGVITFDRTHMYGSGIWIRPPYDFEHNKQPDYESKWYSRADLVALGLTTDDIYHLWMREYTDAYSVVNNVLTLTSEDEESMTYTRSQ